MYRKLQESEEITFGCVHGTLLNVLYQTPLILKLVNTFGVLATNYFEVSAKDDFLY